MSKLVRKNQAKQLRQNHKETQDQESHIFHGVDGAPKHVAIVPLSPSVDVQASIAKLNQSVDVQGDTATNGTVRARVDRFRRNLLYLPARFDQIDAIDVCKAADWVVFVLRHDQEYIEEVDLLLRAIKLQGMTSFVAVIQDVDENISSSKRSRHIIDQKMALGHYLPTLDKLSSLDSKSDCANLVRSLCTSSTKGIGWRDERSWMLVDHISWQAGVEDGAASTATLSGVVRGRGLNPDRLVHVPGWGDYRIKTIKQMPVQSHKRKADEMAVEEVSVEYAPTPDQDDLAELAPETSMMDVASTTATSEQKGVLLDDHHYFEDDTSHIPSQPQKLPSGTSSYQAAWYLEDVSYSDSDEDDDDPLDLKMDVEKELRPEDGAVMHEPAEGTEAGPSEYPESEMHIDANGEDEARQLAEYRSSRKNDAEDDLEFPDEIELHPDVLARERLAKYRGLKNLRTSDWNTAEDALYQPNDYDRLLRISDYRKSYNVAKKESLAGGIPAGSHVEVELADVPSSLKARQSPMMMYSLLRHEHKHTVINLNMRIRSDVSAPVRSKEELVVQIGHRRIIINPVFSASGQTPNDVHKFDRFLHPGQTAVATFTGPVTWGSVPVLVFRKQAASDVKAPEMTDAMDTASQNTPKLALIGTATTVAPSTNRVIAKRIVLTGHPYKIHKKLVTVRYMFFNREDINWFAALPLWTRRGRQGFVKEPLGTHGYFKATFDGGIHPLDAIGVSLYKRVWPRPARPYES